MKKKKKYKKVYKKGGHNRVVKGGKTNEKKI